MPFAKVILQIEQLHRTIIKPLNELVISGSNGTAETIRAMPGVVRKVKENRLAFQLAIATQNRQETFTVWRFIVG